MKYSRRYNALRRSARKHVRGVALDILSAPLMAEKLLGRNCIAPAVTILLIHDTPHSSINRFRSLLSWLSMRGKVVSYSTALASAMEGRLTENLFAFTFDDGLASTLAAANALEEFGAGGCFFVCPGVLDMKSEDARERFCKERLSRDPLPFINWKEVEELKSRGHEIGSHTLMHPRLCNLSQEELNYELCQSKERLDQQLGQVDHFAWPYGKFVDIGAPAARRVFDAGYRSCASGVRGSHGSFDQLTTGPVCIHRENIDIEWPMRHIRYFLARSSTNIVPVGKTWKDGMSLAGWLETNDS